MEIPIFIKSYCQWTVVGNHVLLPDMFCLLKAKPAPTAAHECCVSALHLALFRLLIDSSTLSLFCLSSSILCMQRMRHRGRLREELEWSSAPFTPPWNILLDMTLCFLSVLTLHSVPHSSCPSHPSHLCVTCGHFTSFQFGLAGL